MPPRGRAFAIILRSASMVRSFAMAFFLACALFISNPSFLMSPQVLDNRHDELPYGIPSSSLRTLNDFRQDSPDYDEQADEDNRETNNPADWYFRDRRA
jgi:hypothetical protein